MHLLIIPASSSNPAFSYPIDLISIWKNICFCFVLVSAVAPVETHSTAVSVRWVLERFFPFLGSCQENRLETPKMLGKENMESQLPTQAVCSKASPWLCLSEGRHRLP